jgi:hypothetical protein
MAKSDIRTVLDETDEIDLGTVGRVSGRQSSRPVWFVRQDDTLFLMPITGADSHWYRNVVATPTIHVAAGEAELDAEATPITDPRGVAAVADGFRAKYGSDQIAKLYREPEVAVQAQLA